MSKNQNKTQPQQQGEQDVQDEIKDPVLETNANAGDSAQQGDAAGGVSSDAGESQDSDDSEGSEDAGSSDAGEDAAALAALEALTAPGAPINDAPAPAEAPVQENKPTVADAPNNTPVAVPGARIAPVTLNPIPVKVDVKVQQDNLKLSIIAAQLQTYVEAMGPGKVVTAANGKVAQTALWRTIEQVLKLEGPEFLKGYNMLLDWVAENRSGCMNDRVVYRFFGELTLNETDRRNFNRMLNLLTATADPATRRLGLEQVGLEATLAGFRNGAIQQRVSEFYSL